jgi:hypothetical protein
LGATLLAAASFIPGFANAQEIIGAPRAPNATTTIDEHVLPPPLQKFGGEIGLNAAQSKPHAAKRQLTPLFNGGPGLTPGAVFSV